MRKSVKLAVAAAMAAVMMAGCSSGNSTGNVAADKKESPADTALDAGADTDAAGENASDESYTIGIGQFAEHGSLDNCREGFLKGLAEEGIVEGQNLTVLYENAQTDGGTASQIMANFLSRMWI